jgi:cytochrome c553
MKKFLSQTSVALVLATSGLAWGTSSTDPVTLKPDLKAAENKVSMCIGCHGIVDYKITYPSTYHVPKIAGQNAKYIENALRAYKNKDRPHATMRAISSSLTEQDIVDIAAYYEQKGATNSNQK